MSKKEKKPSCRKTDNNPNITHTLYELCKLGFKVEISQTKDKDQYVVSTSGINSSKNLIGINVTSSKLSDALERVLVYCKA